MRTDNQPFFDGNKRIAWICGKAFLQIHGLTMHATDAEGHDLFMNHIANGMTVPGLAEWIDRHVSVYRSPEYEEVPDATETESTATSDRSKVMSASALRSGPRVNEGSLSEETVVSDPLGIHPRPAAAFAIAVGKSGARVTLRYGAKSADAKSLVQLLSLGARAGSSVTAEIEGEGEGEDDAIAAAQLALPAHLAPAES